MINYEKHRESLDLILEQGGAIAFNKDTKEIVDCQHLRCEDCLFSYRYNKVHYCNVNRIKWLVSEYKEPEVDWSKIPIDTPVLVSDDGVNWRRRYFVRRSETGLFCVYSNGTTSWSADNCESRYKYAKLWEMK